MFLFKFRENRSYLGYPSQPTFFVNSPEQKLPIASAYRKQKEDATGAPCYIRRLYRGTKFHEGAKGADPRIERADKGRRQKGPTPEAVVISDKIFAS